MANYRGHIAGGAISGLAVGGVYLALQDGSLDVGQTVSSNWQLLVILMTISTLFGLWPDVDTNSKAQNLFFGVAFIANIILFVSGYFAASALLGLLAMTPIVGKHRGWTHSRIAAFLVPAPILIVPYLSTQELNQTGLLIYCASVAGYLSHLLLDGLIIKQIRVKGGW